MPPPFNFQDPKTPKNSGTGGIFGALRNFTSHKGEQDGTSSTASTPSASAHGSGDYLSRPMRPGSSTLRRGITTPGSLIIDSARSNGEPEPEADTAMITAQFETFVERLSPDHPTKERIKAANAIIPIIRDFPVASLAILWKNAADMLATDPDQDVFAAALALIKTCIQSRSLTAADRRICFDLISRQLLQQPIEGLMCLALLTSECRNFDGLDMTRLSNLLTKLLATSWNATHVARRNIRKQKAGSSAEEYSRMWGVIEFIRDSIKYSAHMFSETQLEAIIDEVLRICRISSETSDLEQAIQVVETVLTYSSFPPGKLKLLMDVMCAMYAQDESLKNMTKLVIPKMLASHHGPAVLEQMYMILGEFPDKTNEKSALATARGAVQILRHVFRNPQEQMPDVEPSKLLPNLATALQVTDKKLEMHALDLLDDYVERERNTNNMFVADTWTGLCRSLQQCAARFYIPTSADACVDRSSDPNAKVFNFDENFLNIALFLIDRVLLKFEMGELVKNSPDAPDADHDRIVMVVTLLISVSNRLPEWMTKTILWHITSRQLNVPPEAAWLDICNGLRTAILEVDSQEYSLRRISLDLLSHTYETTLALGMRESHALLTSVMNIVDCDMDRHLLQYLVRILIDVATWTDDADLFEAIVSRLETAILTLRRYNPDSHDFTSLRLAGAMPPSSANETMYDSNPMTIAKGFARLILRTVARSFSKTNKVYEILLTLARSEDVFPDARLIALKVLVRLRGDIDHGIFIVAKTESQSLAAALCRTEDSAVLAHINDNPAPRSYKLEDSPHLVAHTDANIEPVSRSSSAAGRSHKARTRMHRPTPPLWMYPGPKGLPADPPAYASRVVYSHLDEESSDNQVAGTRKGALNIGAWLDVVLEMLKSNTVDWEMYSYVIIHLGAQLSNHALFVDAIAQVKEIRRTICEKLMQKSHLEPPAFTNLKKSDAAVCLYQILTMLISYGRHFQKDEEQEPIVKAFVLGIGSWERTSEMCIHGLSVCCHEMPILLVRYLDQALQRMTQIIAQSTFAASVLDFLATLARLPELFRNFGEDNFKNVFGICFRYLQFVREQRAKPSEVPNGKSRDSSVKLARDVGSPLETLTSPNALGDVLPQYVYAITFHAMTFWFMALKLQKRASHIEWIIQNLTYKDDKGQDVLDELAEVTIDMMYRVAYSDRDETVPDPNFATKPTHGMVSSKDYLIGNSIVTMETAGRSGKTQITTRRPSGTTYSIYRPMIIDPPRHQAPITIGLAADAFNDADYVGFTPDHIIQALYAPMIASPSLASHGAAPKVLPDDDVTRRTISTFDRIPALDGHKVGVIYVGERQTDEATILANVSGSADYMDFLNGIGSLTELKGARMNTQGLDREFDSDGKFTYCWRDRVTEIVFHIPTMMPTNLEHDPQCARKKSHIGNDFVKIIFNNSGVPFDFNTFPSDFNYVNIVITPEARASFAETRVFAAQQQTKGKDRVEIFYKVTVVTRDGLPKISAASETKIISGSSLPAFVRLLALNASVFSQVWANREGGEYVSSWRSRLREIKRLQDKFAPTLRISPTAPASATTSPPPTAAGPENPAARSTSLLRRTSAFFSSDASHSSNANRSSNISGTAGDLERSSSAGSQN